MKRILKFMVLIIFVLLLLISCLTYKTYVEYLRAAELDIPADVKTIAIITQGRERDMFYNMMLETFGTQAVLSRFDLIDRENIYTILREQNLYNSDEFSDESAVEIGTLSGAQATIIGTYKKIKEDLSFGKVTLKRKYVDKKWVDENGNQRVSYKYKEEQVNSKIRVVSFDISIRMINNSTASVLHNDFKHYELAEEIYDDDKPDHTVSVTKANIPNTRKVKSSGGFASITSLLQKQSRPMVKKFAKMVAPYMVEELMEFEKTNGRDNINKTFINYVKSGLYEEALELMTDSIDAVKAMDKNVDRAKHWFNIAAVYEMMSDFESARKWYKEAVKEDATRRHLDYLAAIKERMGDKEKLDKQLETDDDDGSW